MNRKLSTASRIIALVSGIGLLLVLTGPIWQIELAAPQYPEGLVLKIHADTLAGDVDVINGLNHYIGMKTLHTKDFVEFKVMPYIIGTLAIFGFLTALINRRWFLVTWVGFVVLFGIVSMVDFYRWNYNYGHNLDPAAAIKVPGQSYQPPLIGYKKLLNFGAYSIPDTGGWIFVGVGLLLILAMYLEFRKTKKVLVHNKSGKTILASLMLFLFVSCSSGPKPIEAGKDECSFCKMIISDPRFASELVTKKGKVYKFDDLHCLNSFSKSGTLTDSSGRSIYLVDFSTGDFIKPQESLFLKSESLKSPMGSNIAAFLNSDSLNYYHRQSGGGIVHWEEVHK